MRRLAQANKRLATAMVVMSLTGAAGMFWVNGRISSLAHSLRPSAAEEQKRFVERIHRDEAVEDALEDLLEGTDADRAMVALAHNGQTDLSQLIPFMFLSISHVHVREGIAFSEQWGRPAPISAISPTLRRMFRDPDHPVCVKRDRGDADISATARAMMVSRGVEVAFMCPLFGAPKAGVRSVVGVTWVEMLRRDQPRPMDADVLKAVERAARTIYARMTEPLAL